MTSCFGSRGAWLSKVITGLDGCSSRHGGSPRKKGEVDCLRLRSKGSGPCRISQRYESCRLSPFRDSILMEYIGGGGTPIFGDTHMFRCSRNVSTISYKKPSSDSCQELLLLLQGFDILEHLQEKHHRARQCATPATDPGLAKGIQRVSRVSGFRGQKKLACARFRAKSWS